MSAISESKIALATSLAVLFLLRIVTRLVRSYSLPESDLLNKPIISVITMSSGLAGVRAMIRRFLVLTPDFAL